MRQLEEGLLLLAGQDASIDTAEMIDRIEQRLSEEGVPVVATDGSPTMQTQEKRRQTTPVRPWKRVWVFAAALVVVVVAIGIPVWLLGGAESEDSVSAPEAVFTWEDDISEWVTVDEMKAMFETLSKRYAGVDLGDGEIEFLRAGSGAYTDQWDWSYDYPSPSSERGWIVSVQGEPFLDHLDERTDPRLPEGVVFQLGWGWEYILKGPNSDEAISIYLMPPRELSPYPDRQEPYDDMYFELVSMMLRELGWAD